MNLFFRGLLLGLMYPLTGRRRMWYAAWRMADTEIVKAERERRKAEEARRKAARRS